MLEVKRPTLELNLNLLRHGESDYNTTPHVIGGRSNHIKLTAGGEAQANALGERLKDESVRFDKVYTSPAIRAMRTAEIACNALGHTGNIIIRDELQELSQGEWEGKSRALMYTVAVIQEMNDTQPYFRAPKGESQAEVEERMVDIVKEWIALTQKQNKNLSVGVFGHGLAFKCLLRNVLGSQARMTHRIAIANCSITELKYNLDGVNKGWEVLKVNDHSHILKIGYSGNALPEYA